MLPFSGVKTTIPREHSPVMKATPAEFVLPKNAIAIRTTAFDSFDTIRARNKMGGYPPGHQLLNRAMSLHRPIFVIM